MKRQWLLASVGAALAASACTPEPAPVTGSSARYVAVPLEASGDLYLVDTELGLTWRRVQHEFPDGSVAAWVPVERMTQKAWAELVAGKVATNAAGAVGSAPLRISLPAGAFANSPSGKPSASAMPPGQQRATTP